MQLGSQIGIASVRTVPVRLDIDQPEFDPYSSKDEGHTTMTSTGPIEQAFDHNDPTVSAEQVRAVYTHMREACPVIHDDRHGGFELLNRYADVRGALSDAEAFSSAGEKLIPPSGLPLTPALDYDEPVHSQWRAMQDPPLTPRAVRALEPTITEIVDTLIDDFANVGSADLVSQLSEPLPALVVGQMMGLSHDEAVEARRIGSTMFASIGTDELPRNWDVLNEYMRVHLAARRAEPREDFLTELASGVVAGQPVDDAGAASIFAAFLVGGHHSTGSAIAGLIRHTLSIDGLRDRLLANRGLIPRVVEESLRLTTPLQLFARTTRCPVNVADTELPEGSRVLLNLAAANRDPREFENAESFDPDRVRNRHVAFGAGIHVCQGQHLARAELRIALGRLLDRLPDLHLDGDAVETGLIGGVLMTHTHLPTAFTPEQR